MSTVNPHFLDHVLSAASTHELALTEDIVSGSGVKLLSAGSKVDMAMAQRLLQHKLSKPLEHCLGVVDGVDSAAISACADALLAQHSLLRALCASPQGQTLPPVSALLARLPLSAPVLALLSVYAQRRPDRLQHAVSVAVMALGLARRLLPRDIAAQQNLARAGLLHDVGELYLAPDFLQRERPLQAEQWKQIVSHPVIGQRVLQDLDGAGKVVAELVLCHHERLDGFGYPRGLRGAALPMVAQILAAAEWLTGLIESGASVSTHANVATKLIPGEFSDALLDVLRDAARATGEVGSRADAQGRDFTLAEALPQAVRVAGVLLRFRESRALIDRHIADASPALRTVLSLCLQRLTQLQASFSSAGLDTDNPERVVEQLSAEPDEVQVEVMSLVREFGWRIRELERESLMRATLLEPADQTLVQGLIGSLKGEVELVA